MVYLSTAYKIEPTKWPTDLSMAIIYYSGLASTASPAGSSPLRLSKNNSGSEVLQNNVHYADYYAYTNFMHFHNDNQ